MKPVFSFIGPYDPKLPGSVSVINWFYLDSDRIIPKRLTYDIEEDKGINVQESDRMVMMNFYYIYLPFKIWGGGEKFFLASLCCIGRTKNLVTG